MKIIDTTRLQYDSLLQTGFMKIDDEHVSDADGYSTITKEYILGMKPLGRIYFGELKHLNYTDGTAVESLNEGYLNLKDVERVMLEEVKIGFYGEDGKEE